MQLRGLLESKKKAVVDRWAELALRVYPRESAQVMKREKDRFQNPVGRITRESLEALYDGVLAGLPAAEMSESLDSIVRIRAVQDLPPSAAVEFLFLLKRAVRDALGEDAASGIKASEIDALDSAIADLALVAFDLFVQCREKIYELRIREIKRRASVLFERMGQTATEGQEKTDDCVGCEPLEGGCGA